MSEEIFYPIDAYYSYKDKKLHYIVKKLDRTGKFVKMSNYKLDPEIEIKVAPFNNKIKYLLPASAATRTLKIKYSEYNKIKKMLVNVYNGKRDSAKEFINKYPTIMTLKEDIYDDYKIETQFLQQSVFVYDENYINSIIFAIWDIEVFHDDKEFPDPSEAKYPINSISYYNLQSNEVSLFFLRNDSNHVPKEELHIQLYNKLVEKYGNDYTYDVRIFETEVSLIHNFLNFVQQTDVLVGWNSLDFDTLYVSNRSKRLNISAAFDDAFGELYEIMNVVDSKQGITSYTYYTTKILSLDYVHLIKFYSNTNYPSYSLNRIAEKILKVEDSKITAKVEIANLNFEYLKDPANFASYNLGDVLLNKFIDDKLLFIKLLFKQKIMTRGFTASSLSVNNILDSYISLKCKEEKLMCISAIKVGTFYTQKIWAIYRKINFLSDERLELITKLREDNKTFSLFSSVEELDEYNYDVLSEFNEDELIDRENVKLTKGQIPFIWEPTKYPGAYVKAPRKGIYLNVVDLDAEAMYPTSIYTTNNSADTWVYLIPENIALKYIYEREQLIEYIKNNDKFYMDIYDVINDVFKRFHHLDAIGILDTIYKKELVLVETGAVFIPSHLKEGFFRKLIKYPISERKRVKKDMKQLTESRGLTKDHPDVQNLDITQLVLKIIANCFSPDTDIVTIDGVKNIKDVVIGDKVYNLNQDTKKLEIDEVVDTQVFDYDDYMYSFKNHQMLDLSVTKDHRFLVKDTKNNTSWQTAEDVYSSTVYRIPKIEGIDIKCGELDDDVCIFDYINSCSNKYGFNYTLHIKGDSHLRTVKKSLSQSLQYKIETFGDYNGNNTCYTIPVCFITKDDIDELKIKCQYLFVSRTFAGGGKATKIPLFMNKRLFVKLIGWYIAEGSLYLNMNDHNNVSSMMVTLTKKDKDFQNKIINVCNELNIQTTQSEKSVQFCNDILYHYFEEECGKGAYNKKIPKWILNDSIDIKKCFFDALYECDGNKNIKRYNTVSYQLTTDLIVLLTSLGNYTKYIKEVIDGYSPIYRITWYNQNIKLDNRISKTLTYYNGKVYCVTTKKNKNVFAGRNGRFVAVGQSVYGYLGFRRSRLFNIILASSITMNSQFMIRQVGFLCDTMIENNKKRMING